MFVELEVRLVDGVTMNLNGNIVQFLVVRTKP